jgi:hypothetical protein
MIMTKLRPKRKIVKSIDIVLRQNLLILETLMLFQLMLEGSGAGTICMKLPRIL